MIENKCNKNEESRKAEVGKEKAEVDNKSKARISKARIQGIATFVIVGIVLVGFMVGTIMLMMSER